MRYFLALRKVIERVVTHLDSFFIESIGIVNDNQKHLIMIDSVTFYL